MDLKQAVMSEPVLQLRDSSRPFEVQTDAGTCSIKKRRASGSIKRKLSETEKKYTVQEKEMTAVVHFLRIWRYYLLGSPFVVKTDNVTTSFFLTQKKLRKKQVRWQDFLAEFSLDMEMTYKPGRTNPVSDALSRKA